MELKLKKVAVRSLLDGDNFFLTGPRVNRREIVDMLMKDKRFSSAMVELACRGEHGILPVKDVVSRVQT